MPRLDEKWITVPTDVGDIQVRIAKPVGSRWSSPTVFYVHGGGWILRNAGTDRLVRELAVGAHAAIVFMEYDRSPEVRYPVAIEQACVRSVAVWGVGAGYAATQHRHLA